MASQDWLDKDFYATLGVSKDATDAQIKKAYRKLARKYHPDQHPDDAEAETKFKDLTEANSVLSDPEQRKEYDAIRAMGSGARFTGGSGGATGAGAGGAADFEDLLGGLFGGGGSRRGGPDLGDLFGGFGGAGGQGARFSNGSFGGSFGGPGGYQQAAPKGADAKATATISFADAIHGTNIHLRTEQGERIQLKVPAGIRDGQTVRKRGAGSPGPAGNGDLKVTIHVEEHSYFSREGDDIRVIVPISVSEAMLGGKVSVPTLDKPVTLRVAPGTSSGKVVRLKSRGVKTKKHTGDFYVTFEIHVPEKLTQAQKDAAQALAETINEDPRENLAATAAL